MDKLSLNNKIEYNNHLISYILTLIDFKDRF